MSEKDDVTRKCRRDIINALLKIAEQDGRPYRCQELWRLIEARENLLRQMAEDYYAELEQIDRELEGLFSRGRSPA